MSRQYGRQNTALWRRLNRIRRENPDPWSVAGLAKRVGVKPQRLYSVLMGRADMPTERSARRLEAELQLPLGSLAVALPPGRRKPSVA